MSKTDDDPLSPGHLAEMRGVYERYWGGAARNMRKDFVLALIAEVERLRADRRHLHALIRAYAHHIGGHEGIDFLADSYESDELTGSDWHELRAIVNEPSSQEPA